MKTWLTALFAAAVLASIAWMLYPRTPPPSFVIISIDTLRADGLGCYGNDRWGRSPTPAADDLAAQGVLFERCTAPRGQTHPSIASLLTGQYPVTHGLRENGQRPRRGHRSFVEHLAEEGYATAGFVANIPARTLTAPHAPEWWTQGFQSFGDGGAGSLTAGAGSPTAGAGGPSAETVPAGGADEASWIPGFEHWLWDESVERQALDWISRAAPPAGSRPFLLWVHFYDVHQPYASRPGYPDFNPDYDGPLQSAAGAAPPPAGVDPVGADGVGADRAGAAADAAALQDRQLSPGDHEQVIALYHASAAGVDARAGRILEALRERGLLENTWIIYTSDHGEELGDHNNYYYHGASIYESVLHIPLVVAGPGCAAGVRSQALVQNVDIAPTVLELAGLESPPDLEGVSLRGLLAGGAQASPRRWAIAEWQDLIYSISDGTTKYIYNPRGACPVKHPWRYSDDPMLMRGFVYDFEELYELKTDPLEQVNLIESRAADADRMRQALQEWLAAPQRQGGFDVQLVLSPEERRLLESLGYTAPDPRRRDVRLLRE